MRKEVLQAKTIKNNPVFFNRFLSMKTKPFTDGMKTKPFTDGQMITKSFTEGQMKRKAQVTIFIMVAVLVLLIVTVFGVQLMQESRVPDMKGQRLSHIDHSILQSHIQQCIQQSKPLIKQISKNAGELEFTIQPLIYEGTKYNYWCLHDSTKGCMNRVFSRDKLEAEINRGIRPGVDECVARLSQLEEQGYSVSMGHSEISTTVGIDKVAIYLIKDIVIKKGENIVSASEFTYSFDLAIGRLFDIANMILNSEIKDGHFDKDQWMKENGAEIYISKRRPYPDIGYNLMRYAEENDDWVELNFAIQGVETVSDFTSDHSVFPSGWCHESDAFFFNPVQARCNSEITSEPILGAELTPAKMAPLCVGDSCEGCGPYPHGSEWCHYDGLVGTGFDLVGTRHYKKSCINGVIFTEECRDYREEMCVSSDDGQGYSSKAICRPNRWKTSMMQDTQSSCEDSLERDCFWLDTSSIFNKAKYRAGNSQLKCYPQVPPGFKFWTMSGFEACQLGNEWIDCDGTSCPVTWPTLVMLGCARLGDCGDSYTIGGKLIKKSFLTSDVIDSVKGPDRLLLPGKDQLGQSNHILMLPPFAYIKEGYDSDAFDSSGRTLSELIERLKEYSKYASSLKKKDLIEEYILDGAIGYHTRHFSLCLPFQMHESGDCSRCSDPYAPCTEYKCKTLGNNCMFYFDDKGYGQCTVKQPGSPPEIIASSFGVSGFSANQLQNEIFALNIFGKLLKTQLAPFTTIHVSFNTSKKAQCRSSPLPLISTNLPFNIDLVPSEPERGFFITHNFTLYAFPAEYVLDDINKIVSVMNYVQFNNPDFIDDRLEEIKKNFASAASEMGKDSSEVNQKFDELKSHYNLELKPLVDEIYARYDSYILTTLNNLNTGKVNTFFNCMDEYGNENVQNFFFSFQMSADNSPPSLLAGEIKNNTPSNPSIQLSTVMNEPSICKASFIDQPFSDMEYEMNCTTHYYDIADGYSCNLALPKSSNPVCLQNKIYFRCRDNIYQPDLTGSNVNTVSFVKDYAVQCLPK
jgi:hypothetical protein